MVGIYLSLPRNMDNVSHKLKLVTARALYVGIIADQEGRAPEPSLSEINGGGRSIFSLKTAPQFPQ